MTYETVVMTAVGLVAVFIIGGVAGYLIGRR